MLWIFSQDYKSFMNVKEVKVDGRKIEGVIGSTSLDHWSKVIGKYDSNERALEILGDIFKKIEETNGTVTYSMPKK